MTPRPADTRRGRVIRAGAASAVATVAAAAAHTVAGGPAPAPWLVLAVVLLAWPVALTVVGRGPSPVRTALAVVVSQAMLHGAFAMIGDAAPTMSAGHGHLHVPAALGAGVAVMAPDAAMLAGHTVAAAVTALAVCHGERMLRGIAAGIRDILRLALPTAPRPRGIPLLARGGVVAPRPVVLLSDLSRRGPPS